jgi:hypothetical protein
MAFRFNTAVPNVARIYDALLGGKNNYEADRQAAVEIIRQVPEAPEVARQNRQFLQRAVRFLATEAGINQFIDIGSGLPTMQNVHEVAQQVNPEARVAYVDHDSIVISHARATLATDQRINAVEGDMRRPRDILDSPDLRQVINLDQPAAILLVAVLHFIPDREQPHLLVDAFKEAVPPGSFLVITHAAQDALMSDHATRLDAVYAETESQGLSPRKYVDIKRFFDGFNLVRPGLVDIGTWRGDYGSQPMDPVLFYGGVAMKP